MGEGERPHMYAPVCLLFTRCQRASMYRDALECFELVFVLAYVSALCVQPSNPIQIRKAKAKEPKPRAMSLGVPLFACGSITFQPPPAPGFKLLGQEATVSSSHLAPPVTGRRWLLYT